MHELKGFVPQQREAAESGVLQREARVAAYLQYVHQANGQKQAAGAQGSSYDATCRNSHRLQFSTGRSALQLDRQQAQVASYLPLHWW